jgi:hypothetical protein
MNNMKIRKFAATLGAGGILAAGLGATTAASVAPVSARTRTVAIEATGVSGRGDVTYRPGRFNIMLGGPVLFGKRLRWSYWGRRVADGRGTLVAEDSTRWTSTVSLHFSHPESKYGERYFENLHVIGGSGIAQHWHWSWRAGNWVG